ncbi:CdaR family transcriptional regulator [Catellatospora citrea]|uniref:CdaR family transcriptional regulator n=1 Tax=Catellatospora citrea TaxID=53366 RepID=A0A8J3KFM4_9ACTN|nr:PucR family transcriptional regulator ligand-binding domain-containing protein [Catellatospora citrea]RKE06881.1 CdaR family transcriptional regulator [Catellatospora citrea]GIF95029.1 CdaR family transcriptional regulator [Catellatospora citrea]
MTAVFPTVREVIALDSVRIGAPRLVAGETGLDRPVRWVHSAEVPDIATLLRGGELVLTTGIGLPADDAGVRAFVNDLAEVGVAGLIVELGRRYTASVPRVMAAAAQKAGMPLVELRRPTPFVQITEAVHALIVDAQLAELRATEQIHQRFTELSVEGAEPAEVVHQAAQLAGCPVVLENLARQVLAYDAAGDRAEMLLDGWEQHSRRVKAQPSGSGRTGYDPDTGWLVTPVGARGQDWGRLLLRWPASGRDVSWEEPDAGLRVLPTAPPTRLTILLERAASTLALGRLIRRDAEGLERQLHGTLLSALLDHSLPVSEVALRAAALGIQLERRRLVGVVVRLRDESLAAGTEAGQAALRDLADAVSQALREAKQTGLTSAVDDRAVGALLAVRGEEEPALESFAAALRRGRADTLLIAAGSGVDSLREARRSLVEARQVAQAARHDPTGPVVHRLPNVGLPGLLHLLRDEPRLQTFVERQLGALLAYDAEHPRDALLPTLRVFLEHGRNKSIAAGAAHLSRPAFYERLARIERILGVDLDSVQACLSLHVALLARDALRG